MSDIAIAADDKEVEEVSAESRSRRSTVSFPYVALDEAIKAVCEVHANAGRECELDQLASWLGTTVASSKFRSTLSAARMFGLVERRTKAIALTELGSAIVDPERRNNAAVQAFLKVPLYQLVYDTFSGKLLPQDAGLESELGKLGVTEKSVAKARQVLQRSASTAGFFGSGRNRLIKPTGAQLPPTEVPPPMDDEPAAATDHSGPNPQHLADLEGPTDPLLRGLWSKLPAERPFSASEQSQWLEMAKLALQMVYGSDDPAASAPAVSANPPAVVDPTQLS